MKLRKLPSAFKFLILLPLIIGLFACGGGGGNNKGYTISGTVSGLDEDSFELYFSYQDIEFKYSNIYELTENGDFTLDLNLPNDSPYQARVDRMPVNPAQICLLENNTGTISSANVIDLDITCHKYKNITITAKGLRLYDLSVKINIDSVINPRYRSTITSVEEIQEIDYSVFESVEIYSAQIIENSTFNISVLKLPYPQDQQVCYINQPSGIAAGEDINIQINCMKAGTIGGSVVGLQGRDLVIQNNGQSAITISQNGQFIFSDLIPIDSNYEVSIANNPNSPNQLCNIANGTGTLSDSINSITVSRITDVQINCYDKPVLNATSLKGVVVLDWPDITADSYNVYYSTDKNFNPDNYAGYADGAFLQNVTSPLTVSGLENKKGYYFVIEAVHNINLPYSEKAGARPDNLVFDNAVNSIATNNVGDVYIGGSFTKVRAASGQGIPLSVHNRSLSIADYPLVNGKVTASVSDGSGGWYIGGDFTYVGGFARGKLAHILSDGTVDSSWKPNVVGVSIEALYYLNNVVYVGGDFTTVDGNPHLNFVAVGTDGSIKPWNLDADGVVYAFISSGSVVYMGGYFDTVGGTSRSRIAAFDNSGVITGFNVDIIGGIKCMQIYNNILYIAGRLQSVAGTNTFGAIALNLDGTLTGWDSGVKTGIIEDLLVHDNIVFFSGPTVSGNIAAVHVDGLPISWDPQINYGYVYHLEIIDDKLIAAGDFQIVGNYSGSIPDVNKRFNIAAYNLSTSSLTLSPYGPYYDMSIPIHRWNPDINNDVTSLSVSGDSIYLGGEFNGLGGVQRKYLLSINADGILSDWSPEPDGTVNSVIENNGTIYVGGEFTQIGLNARDSIAAIDSNGVVTSWNPLITGLSTSVSTLFKNNDTLYIGGYFTGINGQNRTNLASIQFDGTLLDWAPNVNDRVKTITQNNSNLYIGGKFQTVNGLNRSYIASFDNAGDLTAWAPDITNTFNGSLYPSVNTILPIGNNIYFGGHFTSVNSSGRNHVAAVDESGALALWDPNISHSNQLLSVNNLAHYQNKVVIGGKFSVIGVDARNSLALIGEDGVLNSWDPDVNGFINTLYTSDDALFVGGHFSGLNSVSRSNFATYDLNGILQ